MKSFLSHALAALALAAMAGCGGPEATGAAADAVAGPAGGDSAKAGARASRQGAIVELGHVTYGFEGEQRRWSTIARTTGERPRSSATMGGNRMSPTIELEAYREGDFKGETFEITLIFPSPTSAPDFTRPGAIRSSYRRGGILDPFWEGRNEEVSVESVETEGDSAHIRATFTAELCRKETNTRPIDEDSCFPTRGVIDTKLLTPVK